MYEIRGCNNNGREGYIIVKCNAVYLGLYVWI